MAKPQPSKPHDFATATKEQLLDWLFDNVVVCPSSCWLWLGADSGSDGRGANYPKVKLPKSRKNEYVHRIVCRIFHGPPPSPIHQADHKCRNWWRVFPFAHRRCVNPDHLEWVTQSENLKRNHQEEDNDDVQYTEFPGY